MPAPSPGLFSAFGDGCPDLRGSYDLGGEEGRRRAPPGAIGSTLQQAPRYQTVLSIQNSDGSGLRFRSEATQQDLRRAFGAWRDDSAYRYALWRDSLHAAKVPGGLELRRRADAGALAAPTDLPATRELEIDASRYHCAHGWIVFDGEPEPDADAADTAQVSVTRASDGGLIATWRFRRSRTFSLWCGDGCKGNLPLPDEHVQRWWHAPKAEPDVEAPIDWAALAADDPRPLAIRERYVEGHVLTYQSDTPAAPPTPAPAPSPLLVVGIDRAVATSAARDEADLAATAASTAYDAAAGRWRERLAPILPTDTSIASLHCELRACFLDGHAPTMTDVSTLLRALGTDGRTAPELLLIERVDDTRYRFELRLPAQP